MARGNPKIAARFKMRYAEDCAKRRGPRGAPSRGARRPDDRSNVWSLSIAEPGSDGPVPTAACAGAGRTAKASDPIANVATTNNRSARTIDMRQANAWKPRDTGTDIHIDAPPRTALSMPPLRALRVPSALSLYARVRTTQ